MKNHTKVYTKFFQLGEQSTPICECCGRAEATGVHHLKFRGMGGNPNLDYIENLLGMCDGCHSDLEADPEENAEWIRWACDLERRLARMRKLMWGEG